MISYNAIKKNSRLTQFNGTKELVVRNAIPKIKCEKQCDTSVQSCLFQY